MAAFTGTPVGSTQYNQQTAVAAAKAASYDVNGKLRIAHFSYTHAAGAGTGEVNLVKLPAGKLNLFPDLSRIVTSAFVATADLHLGYRAHTKEDGTAVVEDDNAFADNLDVGGGALDQAWVLPAGGVQHLDSREGVVIYAMVDTANIEDGDTIDGYVVFSEGN